MQKIHTRSYRIGTRLFGVTVFILVSLSLFHSVSVASTIIIAYKIFEPMATGDRGMVFTEDGGDGLYIIDFTAAKNLENVHVVVEQSSELPHGMSELSHTVYEYFDVNINTEEDDLVSVKLTFTIEQEWFVENTIDEYSIALYVYDSAEWIALETTMIGKDTASVYYEAYAPVLATFAIAGDQPVSEMQQPFLLFFVIVGAILTTVFFVLMILYKTGYLYFDRAGYKKSSIKK